MDTACLSVYHDNRENPGRIRNSRTRTSSHSYGDYERSLWKTQQHKADLFSNSTSNSRPSSPFSRDSSSWSSRSHNECINLFERNETLNKLCTRTRFISRVNGVVGECSLDNFRMNSKLLSEQQILYKEKRRECAAHLIFHHILLNSWRKRQYTLDNVLNENLILNKTVDNLTVQLKVVRLMDTNDKVKLPESEKCFQSLKEEKEQTENESKRIKATLEAVTEEKQTLEAEIDEKSQENFESRNNLDILENENRIFEEDIEDTNRKIVNEETESCDLKLEVVDLKRKIRQSSNTDWRNKSESLESESWELRSLMETKEVSIKTYEEEKQKLYTELNQLCREKAELQEKLASTISTLGQYKEGRFQNYNNLQDIHTKLAEIEKRIKVLSGWVEKQGNLNNINRKLLYDYTLKNVRRRRFWGNTLYYIVNPLEALKDMLSGFG